MNIFTKTVQVTAKRVTFEEYQKYMYGLPADFEWTSETERTREGYLVIEQNYKHPDTGQIDSFEHWMEVEDFESQYLKEKNIGFGCALEFLKQGKRVARKGWNGKGMFIFLTEGRELPNDKKRSFAYFDGDTVKLGSHIDMKAADGTYVSGWLASQTDMLAEDWEVVGD